TLTVMRTLPYGQNGTIDPFIMLDHFGPKHVKPGQGIGVNPHPHRGFEPVTFLFEGHVEHRDSLGNTGRLDSGGIQWMTSGSGIIHAEDMCKNYTGEGGILHGVQLWVNLPRRHKMTDPGYQNITKESMPVVETEEGKIRVTIAAGEIFGKKGPAKTFTPITALMIRMEPGQSLEIPLPVHHNAFFQLLSGRVIVNGRPIHGSHLIRFNNDGRLAFLSSDPMADGPTEILLLAGEPINEPVYQYGPFVMSSRAEIEAAYRDYQEGKMGHLE
ncbi:MAG: pirin family protein, partial [Bacteroidota bacterium]